MASRDEIAQFMAAAFAHSTFSIESAAPHRAVVHHPVTRDDLRPGGTVSGPTMMALADTALYVAIHATLGITPQAVTTSLNIHFLRRPVPDRALVADCRLLKVGRSLVVGEVSLFSQGQSEPVAHALGTFSIPAGPSAAPPGASGAASD